MQIIQGTTKFKVEKGTAIAIGKFDGIHKGHQKLIQSILEYKKQGLSTVIFTFDKTPALFFDGNNQKELTTKEEKRQIFKEMGIDILVEFPLNSVTAAISAEDFIRDILVEQLRVKQISAGKDLSFGYLGAGNSQLLIEKSFLYEFHVSIIDKVCYQEKEISSSYVREEVAKGNMLVVKDLLDSAYSISGKVQHGNKLGRTIGMPTVNLITPIEKLLPPNGVYYSQVIYQGKTYKGITNIGSKPTVTDENIIGVETYMYDFNQEIYNETILVKLLDFKRPEVKFHTMEELKLQLEEDIAAGEKYEA